MIFIFANAAAFANFHHHGAGDHIARGEVFHARGVTFHKTFAFGIGQVPPLSARAFGDEAARTINAGWVELNKFHILKRQSCAQNHSITIARTSMSGRGAKEHTATAACCENNFLSLETMKRAVIQFPSCDPAADTVFHNQVEREIFDKKFSLITKRLAIKRMEHGMTCAVGRRAGALDWRPLAHFCGVAAERTLVNLTLFITRERHAPMLKFVNRFGGFPA